MWQKFEQVCFPIRLLGTRDHARASDILELGGVVFVRGARGVHFFDYFQVFLLSHVTVTVSHDVYFSIFELDFRAFVGNCLPSRPFSHHHTNPCHWHWNGVMSLDDLPR